MGTRLGLYGVCGIYITLNAKLENEMEKEIDNQGGDWVCI